MSPAPTSVYVGEVFGEHVTVKATSVTVPATTVADTGFVAAAQFDAMPESVTAYGPASRPVMVAVAFAPIEADLPPTDTV